MFLNNEYVYYINNWYCLPEGKMVSYSQMIKIITHYDMANIIFETIQICGKFSIKLVPN